MPSNCWTGSSAEVLARTEEQILSKLPCESKSEFVSICNGAKSIWTISVNPSSSNTPIVLLHGMGSGVALWLLNLEPLSHDRPVYAIDLLGFGRSSRPRFSTDPQQCELEFVESIEEWRVAVGLDKFILLGHSFGGYLASAYTLSHPDHVMHLILADPWGFTPHPSDEEINARFNSPLVRVIRKLMKPFNPFSSLRFLGRLGPRVLARLRSDILNNFDHLVEGELIAQYLYHCNVQPPSGEIAFKTMSADYGWAKFPMTDRLVTSLPVTIPITIIQGSESWIDRRFTKELVRLRPVDVHVISDSGHHVYANQPHRFNQLVIEACKTVDKSCKSATLNSSRNVNQDKVHLKEQNHDDVMTSVNHVEHITVTSSDNETM